MKSFKKSIKLKILIPFSLLSLATLGAMSISSYIITRHQLQTNVFATLHVIAELKKHQIQNWLYNQAEDVFTMANYLLAIKLKSEQLLFYHNQNNSSETVQTICNDLAKRFRYFSEEKHNLKNISLLTNNGEIVCSSNQNFIGQYQSLIQSTSFLDPQKIDSLKSTIYLSPLTKQLTVTLSTPFFSSKDPNLQIGYISADLELKGLDDLIKESPGLRNTNIILIAKDSNLLEASNQIFANSLTNIKKFDASSSLPVRNVIQGKKGQALYINPENVPVLGVYSFLEKNNLMLIIEISQAEAFLPAFDFAWTIFIIGMICLVIVLILIYFLSDTITKPIRDITKIAIALCQGNLDVKAKVTTEDEVGILGKSLNTMSAHLQKTFQELTNQKKAAETAQQEAENANRAKSTFLAKMSHELRTPLNAILGYSEFLEEELTDRGEEDLNEDLQKIQTAGKNLLEMVNNILDICKLETGEIDLNLETFSIVPLIEEIVATSKLLVSQNNNQLKVEYSPDIGSMYGDFTKVRQCLLNLLSNAAKFTKEGIIRFQIKRENVGDQDWIYFQIKDTGIGIASEQQGQLFSAFKQVDSSATRKFDGAGLGLAIAQQYCQIMGGNITLESELNKGSTFSMKLPAQIKNPKTQ